MPPPLKFHQYFHSVKLFSVDIIAPMKKEFTEKLDKLINRKRSNSIYLINRERYQDFIREIKEIKQKWNKDFDDYKMLSNYDVLEVNEKERLIKPKDESNPNIKFYVATDELFGVLHTIHLLFNHPDKDRMDEELKTKYCNISKEVIKIYISCCSKCNDMETM
ncbi:unnamed protein product [Parnassius apollo]|uniref:(apollo) hypothetical protein n=1 Tax=Parnassius apollo TaxID=110799 RepID=A0A8S3W0V5_PARAO|nr:unnamed protein product [Parnassius apollo]